MEKIRTARSGLGQENRGDVDFRTYRIANFATQNDKHHQRYRDVDDAGVPRRHFGDEESDAS